MVVTRLTPVKMAEKPVRAMARIHRSGPASGREGGLGQRGVSHPAEGGGAAGGQEAQHHRDRPAQVQPVRQGVQSGERHVRRPDLEGQDVVGQATEGEGPGEEVQHQAAVHGEQLVELLVGEPVPPMPPCGLVSW